MFNPKSRIPSLNYPHVLTMSSEGVSSERRYLVLVRGCWRLWSMAVARRQSRRCVHAVTSCKYTDTPHITRPKYKSRRPKYKSTHQKYKSSHPKYKSRHPKTSPDTKIQVQTPKLQVQTQKYKSRHKNTSPDT